MTWRSDCKMDLKIELSCLKLCGFDTHIEKMISDHFGLEVT